MNLAQMDNYLTRSESSLYPGNIDQAISTLFVDILGRGPLTDDTNAWYPVLYDTGSDLSLRQQVSVAPEAADGLNASFQAVLNRPIGSGLSATEADLASGAYTQASWRTYLASTQEAQNDINAAYQNILGRSVDAAADANFTASLGDGTISLTGIWSDLANSPEGQGDINALYENVLGRAGDAQGMANYTANLADGAITLADVRSQLAYSAEGQGDINAVYKAVLGRAVDSAALSNSEQVLRWWDNPGRSAVAIGLLRGRPGRY